MSSSNRSRASERQSHPDIQRFVRAQAGIGVWGDTYKEALRELRRGEKRGHWIWYVFPQILGLSMSDMGQRFSIHSLEEAHAYLAHPILGARLKEATQAALDSPTEDVEELLGGETDALKFRSSMTLFANAAQGAEKELFLRVLAEYFEGEMDQMTLDIMNPPASEGALDELASGAEDSDTSLNESGRQKDNAEDTRPTQRMLTPDEEDTSASQPNSVPLQHHEHPKPTEDDSDQWETTSEESASSEHDPDEVKVANGGDLEPTQSKTEVSNTIGGGIVESSQHESSEAGPNDVVENSHDLVGGDNRGMDVDAARRE